jgi:molecular chaperone GrpE
MPKERKDTDGREDEFVEDSAYEPEDDESSSVALAAKLKKLRQKLDACEKEKAEYLQGWQRAKADLVNFKRRAEEEESARSIRASARLIEGILPVLDSFEMAMGSEAWQTVDRNWRVGVEHICNQLKGTLRDAGLQEESPMLQPFDPARHESVRIEETQDKELDGKVVSVIQAGYVLHNLLIRPAKVVVAEYKDG